MAVQNTKLTPSGHRWASRPALTVVGPNRARCLAIEVLEREIAAGRLAATVSERKLLTVARMLTGGGAPSAQPLQRSA